MKNRPLRRARVTLPHRISAPRQLEELEDRLPPGAILGPLGDPGFPSAPPEFLPGQFRQEQAAASSIRIAGAAPEATPFWTVLARDREQAAVGAASAGATPRCSAAEQLADIFAAGAEADSVTLDRLANSLVHALLGPGGDLVPAGSISSPLQPAVAGIAAGRNEADQLTRMVLAGFGQTARASAPAARAATPLGGSPVAFEANVGQTDPAVAFLARGSGYTLFLTPTEAVLDVQARPPETGEWDNPSREGLVVRMQYVGANPTPTLAGLERRPGALSYFTGADASQWHANVPTFRRVEYQELYAGIDLVYYGNAANQFEYDFVVSPGADPTAVQMRFEGADRLEVDSSGDLLLHSPLGALRQPRPFTYQEVGGTRQEVPSRYVVTGGQVGFEVGAYDASRPLVIDPVLSYSTYLGGSMAESGYAIAVDPATQTAYVTGETESTDFPVTSGVYQTTNAGFSDVFVAKLDPDGLTFEWATYLGGNGNDRANAIALDSAGNVLVAGRTGSANFPTTPGAFQPGRGGGTYEAFVTKLNPTGSALAWSTYVGGEANDAAFGLAVDSADQVYVVGGTLSQDFPITPNAFQFSPLGTDAFLTRLSADGTSTDYSSYLGGGFSFERANGVALDPTNGQVYVVGRTPSSDFPTTPGTVQPGFGGGISDGFVLKLDLTQSGLAALVWGTYLGGTGDERIHRIAVDAAGNAYVTGQTSSEDFPTANPVQDSFQGGVTDAFVSKISADGSTLVYSTYLGGTQNDRGSDIAVNAAGEAYVTGPTSSADFPILDPIQATLAGGSDAFLTKLNATGDAIVWSTFHGGSGDEDIGFTDTTEQGGVALDPAGNVYLVGKTESSDFPLLYPAQGAYGGLSDAFVARISDTPGPGILACFVWSPDTLTASVGVPIAEISVTAYDSFWDVVADYTGEVTFATTDPAAVIPATYTFQLSDMGVATFAGVFTFMTPGVQELYIYDSATFTVFGVATITVA